MSTLAIPYLDSSTPWLNYRTGFHCQVQLATNQTFNLPLPTSVEKDQAGAGKIINAIAQLEAEYQLKLGETNQQFADKEFRS